MQISRDTLWKGILEDLFEDFLLYFYPDWTKKEVDLKKGFEFLDKELEQIYPESERKNRFADKLVKVYLKSGTEQWMLIHIEVQGYADPDFVERMFTYFYRIRDKYNKDILALAILTDEKPHFHPKFYKYQYQNTRLTYHFDTFKILEKTEAELHKPHNPFSMVMLTAWKAIQKQEQNDAKRLQWKIALIRNLLAAGYKREKIERILEFIRFYVNFSEESQSQVFEKELEQITKSRKNMGIIEAIKQEILEIGIKKGEKLGLEKGVRNMLLKGFSEEEIAEILGVDKAFIQKVKVAIKNKR